MTRMYIERIRQLCHPLYPKPTNLEQTSHKIESIHAIIFDIYGTLFISTAGDIAHSSASKNPSIAVQQSMQALGIKVENPDAISELYHRAIQSHHKEKKQAGIAYPEVDIIQIWSSVLEHARIDTNIAEALALEFELRYNPVWPMLGMQELLSAISAMNIPWGIVSNAQFYTKLLFNAFSGIETDYKYAVWSYEEGCGKPDVSLFAKISALFKSNYGIDSAHLLYLGNDMLNDVWCAKQAGLKTALFAGDERSLRLRSDDARCKYLKPDYIVTDLFTFLRSIQNMQALA